MQDAMDLSFFQRRQASFAGRSAARLDYRMLVTSLATMQAAGKSAQALRSFGCAAGVAPGPEPLVELLLGGPRWREAIAAQCGCFHPSFAQRPGKAA
jgi:anti-sigma factor RsiW